MKKLLLFPIVLLAASAAPFVQPRAAEVAIVPLLDLKSGYLLGASQGRQWLTPAAATKKLKNGANYRVYRVNRALGNGKATLPVSKGAPCDETLFSDVKPDFAKSGAEFAIGGNHNPLPRAVRSESTNQATYRQAVAAILKSRGIAKPIVQIQQIWRVDLDGDGTQEVLLTATRKDDSGDPERIAPASRKGDYSLLLLRRLVRGKVENQLIEGSFYPQAKEFNAPGFFKLGAVLDADGDGKMEFLVRGRYYEGDWTSLYGFQGSKVREVLVEGCGA